MIRYVGGFAPLVVRRAEGAWVETTDGLVVLGSESGLLDIPPQKVRRLGRLQPGKLFLVDLERGRIVEDEELKQEIATQKPYGEWYRKSSVRFSELKRWEQVTLSQQPLRARQRAFGYSQEELLGENVKILMPAPWREEHDGYLSHYQKTGEAHIIGIGRQVEGRRRDGSTLPLDLSVSEIHSLETVATT